MNVATWFSDPADAVTACAALAAIGQALSSMQLLANRAMFGPAGLLDWRVLRTWYGSSGVRGSIAALIPAGSSVVVILGALKLAASILILGLAMREGSLALPLLLLTAVNMALSVRTPVGMIGADYMGGVVIAALTLAEWSPAPTAHAIGLSFIALQACVAYFVAGIGKAPHQGWRDGVYIREVFATASFGHRQFAGLLHRSDGPAVWLGRGIVAFECLFPLVLFVPPDLASAMLAAGLVFHLTAAVTMGLNTFVWAFPATYPAILFLNGAIHARLMSL